MSYREFNENLYADGYWRRWPSQDIWLDARLRLDLFASWLRADSGARFLDLAGGAGNFTDRLSPAFGRAVLTDIAFDALRQNTNSRVAKVQADLLCLPFVSGSFDRILLSDVLEHLEVKDLPLVLREVRRVCRSGGTVVVFTNCRGLRLRPFLLRLRNRRGRGELDWKDLQDGHLNRLSDGELSALVTNAGFDVRRKQFFSHAFEPVVTALIDLIRPATEGVGGDGARAGGRIRQWPVRGALQVLTWVMALDLLILGRFPGGGVFLALEPALEVRA